MKYDDLTIVGCNIVNVMSLGILLGKKPLEKYDGADQELWDQMYQIAIDKELGIGLQKKIQSEPSFFSTYQKYYDDSLSKSLKSYHYYHYEKKRSFLSILLENPVH